MPEYDRMWVVIAEVNALHRLTIPFIYISCSNDDKLTSYIIFVRFHYNLLRNTALAIAICP